MAPDRINPTQEELVMMFAASCVEGVADRLQCDYEEVFERMDRVGLIEDYIVKCYDVLHLESRENIITDLIETLHLWENRSNPQPHHA